jgi:hypothetical protein
MFCTLILYLPLYFTLPFIQSPLDAAKSVLPISVLFVAFSCLEPSGAEALRRYRPPMWLGWVVTTLFLGLRCLVDGTTRRTQVRAVQALPGKGSGAHADTNAGERREYR